MNNRVIFFVLISCITVSYMFAYNLTNGSFESGFTDWRTFAVGEGCEGVFTITDDAYEGLQAVSMQILAFDAAIPGADFGLDRAIGNRLNVTGSRIKISFAAKKISDGDTYLRFTIAEFDSESQWLRTDSTSYYDVPKDGEYHVYNLDYNIIKPEAAYINLAFRIADDSGLRCPGHYQIDAVTLIEPNKATSPFPANNSQLTLNQMGELLSWTNPEPVNPDGVIKVDVWGSNSFDMQNAVKLVDKQSVTSVQIPFDYVFPSERCYWRVDTYDSTGSDDGTELLTVGDKWNFYLLSCYDVHDKLLNYRADISGPTGEPDCIVDFYDFAMMSTEWLNDNSL
ncbi:hypothetical protein SMSP2_02441 [Limihaloglobus sulfuriphilus]|uniref:Uncharacterized protein n=1 Tax=Limihaloglobus sulfuriphilus TaxID=1851148 RepID=A0A1Q2MH92_9BACT|nr:hypothetical protein [Limihaloglobus sulfuriphilus]AQQ72061.1 hypothetical protein SMSP2_02441 [Limihaloglobus sulfuriphilus]